MAVKIFIATDRLDSVLEKLSTKIDLLIPASLKDDKSAPTGFVPFVPGTAPAFDRQTTTPLKKALLPQVETLLRFEYHKDPQGSPKSSVTVDDQRQVRPTLVFGARPCDVKALTTLDRVFSNGPYVDPYYVERRKNTLFATLVCRQNDAKCFCTSVGGGPADMEGSHLRIVPVDGGYVVEALSPEAQTLLENLADAPDSARDAQAGQIVEEALKRRVGELDTKGSPEAFRKRFDQTDYWFQMINQCLGCGVCTYVCPTCYCFTITDEVENLKGERLRSWDSCMFYHYTLEASGHNPRPTKLERYRNRVGHKFSYIPERYEGLLGCCGCGRCIRSCPVSIDIRQVVGHLKENTSE
ncbi:MAG: 4Fe-4S dicluster domain-containing protein [Syntrophobacteraceae bacterium]|nr:4Fe-4S dicluster domain-containing protein [Syntrophobacteraceae bacterium]